MMNPCEKYEEWISAYVDGALDDAEQAELLVHLQTCPACLAIWQEYEMMSKALKAMKVQPPVTLAADVMAHIQERPVLTMRRGGMARRFAAIAAVFAVVAFVGVYTFWTPLSAEFGETDASLRVEESSNDLDMAARSREATENWNDEPTPKQVPAEVSVNEDVEMGESEEIDPFNNIATEPIFDVLPEPTLFDVLASYGDLGDWDELRQRLVMGGYHYEVETDGFFTARDPYRPGSYLYGKLQADQTDLGNTIVTLLGYAYRTEDAYSRVELRSVYGEVRYYYNVLHVGEAGRRVDTWAQLRELIVSWIG